MWFTIQNNLCPINETDKTGWYSPDGQGGWRYAGREDIKLSAGMKYVYEAEYVFDGETLLKFLDEKTKNFANGKTERAEERPRELTFEEKREPTPPLPPFISNTIYVIGTIAIITATVAMFSYPYFYIQHQDNLYKYEHSTVNSSRRAYYDKASQASNDMQTSLKVFLIGFGLTLPMSILDDKERNRKSKFSPITPYIIPQSDGGIILFSYSF